MRKREMNAFKIVVLLVSLLIIIPSRTSAQDEPKSLDPNDPRLTFSFSIRPGGKPLDFKVQLGKDGAISAVSVQRKGSSDQLQVLPVRDKFPDQVTENWLDHDLSLLIAHADLNFDGFEDLELLQNYVPHLDKKLYCVYLWNKAKGRFDYSKELTEISANLEVDAVNKTLTEHESWQGGAWQDSRYRWNGTKLELIAQDSLLGDWSLMNKTECGFAFTCTKLVKGRLTITLEKQICTPDEMYQLPECPSADTSPVPKSSPQKKLR